MCTMDRSRPLVVHILKASRDLGTLPTALHSDAHTLILGLVRNATGRGKPLALPPPRADAVDAALRKGGKYPGGVEELAAAIGAWQRELHCEGTAEGINSYYDAWRAEGYTAALAGPQEALTLRCAELAGRAPSASRHGSLLDLGCGSGLSMQPLHGAAGALLGVDLSLEMLKRARRAGMEVIQADAARPLPLRAGCFDAVLSVSALQFLHSRLQGK